MDPLLPAKLKEPVSRYLVLLDRWSRTHALTSLEREERFEELILDSTVLLPFLKDVPAGGAVADFGTGMGVPAVVLALARPDLTIYALDKATKKIAFVKQAAMELGLANLRPLAGRAEDLAPLGAQVGVAKAVGPLDLLMGWWDRHGEPGATFLALKGAQVEVPAGVSVERHAYRLPTRGERCMVVMRRV